MLSKWQFVPGCISHLPVYIPVVIDVVFHAWKEVSVACKATSEFSSFSISSAIFPSSVLLLAFFKVSFDVTVS